MTRQRTQRQARRRAGFTLLELMIALVVLAILLVATAASLGVFSPRSSRAELHDATNELLNVVEFARMRAAMSGAAVSLQLTQAGDSQVLVLYDQGQNSCQPVPAPTLARQIPFTSNADGPRGWVGNANRPKYPEVALVTVSPANLLTPGNGLCFRPDGRVLLENGLTVPPDPATNLAAGEAQLSLRMRVEKDAPAAIQHDVIVPFNGLAKVRYVVP